MFPSLIFGFALFLTAFLIASLIDFAKTKEDGARGVPIVAALFAATWGLYHYLTH